MYNCLLNTDVSRKPQIEYAPKASLSLNPSKLLLLCPFSVIAPLGSFLSKIAGVLLFFLPLSFLSQQPSCPSTLPLLFCSNPSYFIVQLFLTGLDFCNYCVRRSHLHALAPTDLCGVRSKIQPLPQFFPITFGGENATLQ